MKIKLLINKGDNKAGDIVDGISSSTSSWFYFYSNASLTSVYEGEYEIVKDEPTETKPAEKFDSYQKNMIDLIRDLSAIVSEIKFK